MYIIGLSSPGINIYASANSVFFCNFFVSLYRCTVILFLAFFLTLIPFSYVLAADEVGIVLGANQGAWIDAGAGGKEAAVKDSIYVDSILRTNYSGKMQIMLTDDSSLTLGNDTLFSMKDYDFGDVTPSFVGHLSQGLVRVITGRVVEQNPEGFRITTPEGTVGIRGTVFALETRSGTSTLYVENTTKGGVYLNNTFVPSGHKAVLTSGKDISITPITQEDRAQMTIATGILNRQDQADDGSGTAQAGLGDTSGSSQPQSELANLAQGDIGSGLVASAPSRLPLVISPTFAAYSGTLAMTLPDSGSFTFDVHLGTGAVSSAVINGTGLGSLYSFSGSGSWSGPLNISFTGVWGGLPANASMSGTGTKGDPAISGSYNLDGSLTGTFSGTKI